MTSLQLPKCLSVFQHEFQSISSIYRETGTCTTCNNYLTVPAISFKRNPILICINNFTSQELPNVDTVFQFRHILFQYYIKRRLAYINLTIPAFSVSMTDCKSVAMNYSVGNTGGSVMGMGQGCTLQKHHNRSSRWGYTR